MTEDADRDELVEYGDQLVVLPRLCELCLEHLAVYYSWSQWPMTYECRACLEGPVERERQVYGDAEIRRGA